MKCIKGIFKWLGILFLVLIALALILPSENNNTQINTENNDSNEAQLELPVEDRINNLVSKLLSGNNNLGKPILREVNTPGGDGNITVLVDFNISDNLTNKLRISGMKSDMSDVHINIFKNFASVSQVIVTGYFPLIDKYGNESDGVVYRTKLTRDVATKINWNQDELALKYDIIPGLWEAYKIHHQFQ